MVCRKGKSSVREIDWNWPSDRGPYETVLSWLSSLKTKQKKARATHWTLDSTSCNIISLHHVFHWFSLIKGFQVFCCSNCKSGHLIPRGASVRIVYCSHRQHHHICHGFPRSVLLCRLYVGTNLDSLGSTRLVLTHGGCSRSFPILWNKYIAGICPCKVRLVPNTLISDDRSIWKETELKAYGRALWIEGCSSVLILSQDSIVQFVQRCQFLLVNQIKLQGHVLNTARESRAVDRIPRW